MEYILPIIGNSFQFFSFSLKLSQTFALKYVG